jgi:hypothetical protein
MHFMRFEEDAGRVLKSKCSQGPREMQWDLVGGPWIEIKTIELALNYMEDMTRFQLNQPKVHGAKDARREEIAKELLYMWIDCIQAAKLSQMNIEPPTAWPQQEHIPWTIKDLSDMPVVVWLRRQW